MGILQKIATMWNGISLHKNRSNVIYIAIILICYAPVLLNEYAQTDDYTKLYFQLSNLTDDIPRHCISGGRWLFALFSLIDHNFVLLPSSLTPFRLIYILTITLYSILFYNFLVKNEFFSTSPLLRFLLPLTLACSSPFYLYGAWFTCWPYGFAILLSFLAYAIIYSSSPLSYGRISWSLVFLVAAFLIYQPAGMLFIFYIGLSLIYNKINIKKFLLYLSLIIAAMFIAFFFAKIAPTLVGITPEHRGALDYNFLKSFMFFIRALPYSLTALFLYKFNSLIAYIITLFLGYCLYILFKNKYMIFVFLSLMFFSYSPVLLTISKHLAIRSSVCLISFILLIFLAVLNRISKHQWINNILLIMFSSFILAHTSYIFYNNLIVTSKNDFKMFSSTVTQHLKNPPQCIKIDLSEKEYYMPGHFTMSDELGVRSSAVSWSYPGMIAVVNHLNGLPNKGYYPDEHCVKIFQKDIK